MTFTEKPGHAWRDVTDADIGTTLPLRVSRDGSDWAHIAASSALSKADDGRWRWNPCSSRWNYCQVYAPIAPAVAPWIRADNPNLQTRDGKHSIREGTLRLYATDCGGLYPVHGAVNRNNDWCARSWGRDGKQYANLDFDALDLIEAPPEPVRRECWVNMYENDRGIYGYASGSRKSADSNGDKSRIACVRVEFAEVEGL